MKILCVIDSLGAGGAQRQLVNLAIGFKEKGHDVSFLIYHEILFYKEFLDKVNIPVKIIIERRFTKRFLRMRKYIRGGNFDVVLSFLTASNFASELSGFPFRKWKLIVGERSANPNILTSFKLRFYRLFHIFSDYVVANSHENIRMVKKINPFLNSSKCKVIYNIVDLRKWVPSKDYLPLQGEKFQLVIAASHRKIKNLNGLIEAVNLLNDHQKSKLIIKWYGEKDDNSLEMGLKKIREYGLSAIFEFHAATNEILAIMQHADGVGLFSFHEGFPNVICEAMACAKPVIASKVSDISSVLSCEAFLCEAHKPESIKNTILYLVSLSNEERYQEGKKNRMIAEELFNKTAIVDKYLSLMS